MKIAIHDSEGKYSKYPNIALMKISSWHKAQGDTVEWFNPLFGPFDKVYSSKVFTWTEQDKFLPVDTVKGGTGYDVKYTLPEEIEHTCPDYSMYACDSSYGFVTRGCVRKCEGCFVPAKEGAIKAHADVDEFLRHDSVILMDNNILAHDHGINQIEKLSRLRVKVDFNQGLDARLIDSATARLLSKLRWKGETRFACDSQSQIEPVRRAIELLRWHNCNPAKLFCYVLVKDLPGAIERVRFLKSMYVLPFAQPYRDKEGNEPAKELKDFARWVNRREIYKKSTWEEYHI